MYMWYIYNDLGIRMQPKPDGSTSLIVIDMKLYEAFEVRATGETVPYIPDPKEMFGPESCFAASDADIDDVVSALFSESWYTGPIARVLEDFKRNFDCYDTDS